MDKSKLHSESSLEEKSKNSSSRLHYKKFTRGKDITRYSNKDLANIFGKKTLNHVEEKQVQVNDPTTEDKNEDTKLIVGGCMKDYFQSKLGKRLGNDTSKIVNNIYESKPDLSDDGVSCVAFKGFSSQTETTKATPDATTENGIDDHAYTPYNSVDRGTNNFKGFSQATEQAVEPSKYISFSKASGPVQPNKYISFSKASEPDVDPNKQKNSAKVTELVEDKDDSQIVSKKKKKKKPSAEQFQLAEEVSVSLTKELSTFASNNSEIVETISRKSKKIKKMKFEQADENNCTTSVSVIEVGEDEVVVKKPKKNKRIKICEGGEAIINHSKEVLDNSEEVSVHKLENKTSKKKKKEYQQGEITDPPISEVTKEEFKQKKRKAETPTPTENEHEDVKLKKKKKNRGIV